MPFASEFRTCCVLQLQLLATSFPRFEIFEVLRWKVITAEDGPFGEYEIIPATIKYQLE